MSSLDLWRGTDGQVSKNGSVAVAFVGDRASNQGTIQESLNLASVWNFPCVFVEKTTATLRQLQANGRFPVIILLAGQPPLECLVSC